MAQFSVKTGRIRPLSGDEATMARELAGYADSIGRIANNLNFNSWKAASLRTRLRSASQNTYSHRAGMSGLSSALAAVMDKYDDTERRTANKLGEQSGQRDIVSKIVSVLGKNNILQSAYKGLLGMVGMGIGGLGSNIVANWRDNLLGNVWNTIGGLVGKVGNISDKLPIAKWRNDIVSTVGAVMASFPTAQTAQRSDITSVVASWWDKIFGRNKSQETIGEVGERICPVEETKGNTDSKPPEPVGPPSPYPPKYDLPEYALRAKGRCSNGQYGPIYWAENKGFGTVAYRNRNGYLSCTYYTMRKLDEKGLGYPCIGGPGGGGQWYRYFDTNSGLSHYPGANALNDLKDNLTLPQANVVVSFDSNDPEGHVMLIDKIYKDKYGEIWVEYNDMFPDGEEGTGYIGDEKGSNLSKSKTLQQFLSDYASPKFGNCKVKGAVVIGRGNE